MVNSSFQTENCWIYLGRQLISQAPYLCIASALEAYLSAGLTGGTWTRPSGACGLGALRISCASFGSTTLYPFSLAPLEKLLTTASLLLCSDGFAGRRAVAKALFRQIFVAIIDHEACLGQLSPLRRLRSLMCEELPSLPEEGLLVVWLIIDNAGLGSGNTFLQTRGALTTRHHLNSPELSHVN